MLFKLPFICLYLPLSDEVGMADYLDVLCHGLRLDSAIAGYVCIVPSLMLLTSLWVKAKVLRWAWHAYMLTIAILSAVAYISNLALYGFWGFPLDSTPLLYIKTSPADAMASLPLWQTLLIFIVMGAVAVGLFLPFKRWAKMMDKHTKEPLRSPASSSQEKPLQPKQKFAYSLVLLLLTAALIIPIRGGFSTGTNHTGSVYFSTNTKVNHAAVNPIFSFIESVLHQEEIGTRYRFMDSEEAARLFATMIDNTLRSDSILHLDNTLPNDTLLHSESVLHNDNTLRRTGGVKDWNVILLCLESFSKSVMTEGGMVEGVTPNLDRYTTEGLYFANIYANSFRTDRALVSVLSSLPAQPTMSVMDMPRISTSLPSLARTLGNAGYDTHFYYGGDTGFSNMKSYIMGTGFAGVTEQKDFPSDITTGKWGVADGPLYETVLSDIVQETAVDSTRRFYKVVLTGSSHEPFDVPDFNRLSDPALNAFAYADDCLGQFIESLKKQPCWKNTLVVIVPDHLGAYPSEIDNYQLWRYEIPLLMIGGVIEEAQTVATIGSQIDISATVLAMLGRDHSEYTYSKALMDASAPHFAFFAFPNAMGIIDATGAVIYDNTAARIVEERGNNTETLLRKAQAYLQTLYDDLDRRNKGVPSLSLDP